MSFAPVQQQQQPPPPPFNPPPPPPPPAAAVSAAALQPPIQPPSVPSPAAPEAAQPADQSMDVDIDQPAKQEAAAAAPNGPATSNGGPSQAGGAEEITEKTEKLSVREEKQQQIALEEMNYNESEILKAYEALMKEDPREHLNLVFIGHIDAGKSTLAGQILFTTGGVDKRTIEKYEKEAKEKSREGWYMAYIMDTNEEERSKGITQEVGRAHFETDKHRYTVLDAPGHKNYVPNMIQGACQADVAILVISARKGEFETGFERGGQTREHAQLAKTLGVKMLVIVVNKLDCPSVAKEDGSWDKERYDSIVEKMTPFLKSSGYNMKKEVLFLPISALYGHNIKEVVPKQRCSWYEGPALFDILDSIESTDPDPLAPVRLPIVDKWRDMGTIVMGKIESGFMRQGDVYELRPNRLKMKIEAIYRDEKEVTATRSGENLRLRVTGVEDSDIMQGFVITSFRNPVPMCTQFEAQLMIVELLEHNPIFTVGYKSILHIHASMEECEITKMIAEVDMKTKEQKKARFVKQGGMCICRIAVDKPICVETFQDLAAMGRFTLRDEGRTIAIGKVTKLPKNH
ncbi:P-loop containing nucleoside triphosphate hydrolase protein [Dunaliella salina]|uniref:P-loop containing nucleoside triphosphate hydrolase protein n=1 Tax=Dunaliella salina TaxID=3046 RepID=A0ABQ7GIR3_DUNSA|nr:P-loop containing nucleoside triphosphate hydrolase protein [Dunaliella salina]|eukprot:KAF5834493.1 P-loop containing nucleoside triphosphate hydrolase protein [Dunaliella salina]